MFYSVYLVDCAVPLLVDVRILNQIHVVRICFDFSVNNVKVCQRFHLNNLHANESYAVEDVDFF